MVMLKVAVLAAVSLMMVSGVVSAAEKKEQGAGRWSEEKAKQWAAERPWMVGCNYIPANAINQLEMWQADTFDLKRIDEELGWAEGLGFNVIRVFLHDLLWEQDKEGFLTRMDQFLEVADKHHIGVMFVFFDGCWDPVAELGKQRAPRPHTHNSGWVQSPSQDVLADESKQGRLEGYVKGVMGRFKDDKRVVVWDVYNEPDNPNVSAYGPRIIKDKSERALVLLKKVFGWAREVGVSQPLTAGVWHGNWESLEKMVPVGRYCIEQSDVVSFHNYGKLDELTNRVEQLKQFDRPLICTEYMARPQGSTFKTILPYFKKEKIGAINWGFVEGKSQTNYPWDSWTKQYTAEPPVWFHDIFRTDGEAYRPEEVKLIRQTTGRS